MQRYREIKISIKCPEGQNEIRMDRLKFLTRYFASFIIDLSTVCTIFKTIKPIFVSVIVFSLGLITVIFPRMHIFYGQPTLTALCAVLLIILCFDKGNFKKYGFNKVKIKMLMYSVLVTFIYVLLFSFLQFKYFHVSNNGGSNNNTPIYLILLSALIGAPVYEELLSRGYLQSNLAHLKKYGFSVFKIYLSLPVLISALFFALGHIAIFNGMNMIFVLNTILYTFVLGIISGYFREKTDSIYPSFAIHSFANFANSLLPFVFIQQLDFFNI